MFVLLTRSLTICLWSAHRFEIAGGATTSAAGGDIETGGSAKPLQTSVLQNQDEKDDPDTMQLSYDDSFKVINQIDQSLNATID